MKQFCIALTVLLGLFTTLFSVRPLLGVDLTQLQDPRPATRVLDQAAVLGNEDRLRLTATIGQIIAANVGELMVVTIDTTNGANLRQAGTALFNRWRIGTAHRHNGTLLVIAMTDRQCEIILGDDVDSDNQVLASQHIFDDEMKPRLRAGDAGGALVRGAEVIAQRIYSLSTPATTVKRVDQLAVEADSYGPSVSHNSAQPQPTSQYLPTNNDMTWGWWLGGAGSVIAALFSGRAWLRYRTRICASCRTPMQRLGESADDAHLSSAQRTEEKIGSVDYDVWACTKCDHVITVRWGALFTSYARCPGCGAKTNSCCSTTLLEATHTNGGLFRVDEKCEHCQWSNSYTRRTAPLKDSSSNRSDGGGGSGRSSGRGGGGGW